MQAQKQEQMLIQTLIKLKVIDLSQVTEALAYQTRLPKSQWQSVPEILQAMEWVHHDAVTLLMQIPLETLEKNPQVEAELEAVIQKINQQIKTSLTSGRTMASRKSLSPAEKHCKNLSEVDQAFLQNLRTLKSLENWMIEDILNIQERQPKITRQSLAEIWHAQGYFE